MDFFGVSPGRVLEELWHPCTEGGTSTGIPRWILKSRQDRLFVPLWEGVQIFAAVSGRPKGAQLAVGRDPQAPRQECEVRVLALRNDGFRGVFKG